MPRGRRGGAEPRLEFAAQPKGVFALVGATLHPVSGPTIPAGTLIVAEGKIAAIGPAGTPIPPEAQTIDLGGLDVWPGPGRRGLVDRALRDRQPARDSGFRRRQPVPARAPRPAPRCGPTREHIPVTRANGVLTAYVQPTGGLISGQGCVIDLHGWVPRELVMADPAGPERDHPRRTSPGPRAANASRPWPGSGPGAGPGQEGGGRPRPQARRKEQLEAIREQFRKALALRRSRGPGAGQGSCPAPHRSSTGRPGPLRQGREAGDLPGRAPHRDPRRAGDRQGPEAQGGHLRRRRGVEGRRPRSRRPASRCSWAGH